MANNFLLILSLLGFIMCSQAMLFFTGLDDTTCKNNTVRCNNLADQVLNPNTCCQLADGYICCEDISTYVWIISAAIVSCCVCLPLLLIICCCCCCFTCRVFGKIAIKPRFG